MNQPLWTASAADLATLYATGEATPVAALEACLSRLEVVNPALNAVVSQDPAGARQAARESAGRWRAGTARSALDGVPLTVKDNIPTRGLRTTWGSRLYADHVPDADETPVRRLREAGAVILDKTNVPEMTLQGYTANPLFGPTGNPWRAELTPGGSSGGAVAAVGAGVGPVALATDGGGSIRRPACHGGLVGLKPTTGRVPRRDGFPPILLDFEVIGPIARTVADLRAVMAVIAGAEPAGAAQGRCGPFGAAAPAGRRRILHVPTFAGAPVDPEVAASVAEAAAALSALGHRVEDGGGFDLADRINALWPVIAQTGLAWLLRDRPDRLVDLGPDLRAMAEAGAALSATDHFDALHAALCLRRDMAELFRGHDLVLTPTAAALPWPRAEPYPRRIAGREVGPRGAAVFTGFVNAAHLPAITVPCRPSRDGLPIGFQLVGAWERDEDLLAVAAAYEAAHPWAMPWQIGPARGP